MSDTRKAPAEETSVPAEVRILVSTAPPDVAQSIAHRLVEERLAACVNLVPGVRSVYRWQEAVQDDPETLMVMKTVPARIEALRERLLALHPYEVPEILVLRPEDGHAAYLAWVHGATEPPSEGPNSG